jgi:hypothetical protein
MHSINDACKLRYQLVTGQHIAHAQRTKYERAFLAADLHIGRFVLVQPTVLQCAALWRVNPSYVHAALRKDVEERERILAGLDPLVLVTDDELVGLAHLVGPDRWLNAGARAEI